MARWNRDTKGSFFGHLHSRGQGQLQKQNKYVLRVNRQCVVPDTMYYLARSSTQALATAIHCFQKRPRTIAGKPYILYLVVFGSKYVVQSF